MQGAAISHDAKLIIFHEQDDASVHLKGTVA
jgi:hypothetical protein